MLWTDLLSCEFEDAVKEAKGVCALPIGCVERHGLHLPLGCDSYVAARISRKAAEIEPVVVYPEIYFGEKSGAGEFPGTIILPTDLIEKVLEHCCFEIARNGFRKIVLMNFHGGNRAMLQSFARSILQKKPDFQVMVYDINHKRFAKVLEEKEKYPFLAEEDLSCIRAFLDEKKRDGHGGFAETALCAFVAGDQVRPENMGKVDGTSSKRLAELSAHGLYSPFEWMANYPHSLAADHHDGLNERIIRALGERVVEDVADLFRFLKEETASEEYLKEWLAQQ